MNTTLHQNRPEDTQNWTKIYLEPHDHRIYYYVNTDLRHHYGISAPESQTFLLAKRPQRRRARRNGCFRRLTQWKSCCLENLMQLKVTIDDVITITNQIYICKANSCFYPAVPSTHVPREVRISTIKSLHDSRGINVLEF